MTFGFADRLAVDTGHAPDKFDFRLSAKLAEEPRQFLRQHVIGLSEDRQGVAAAAEVDAVVEEADVALPTLYTATIVPSVARGRRLVNGET
jgi:hypothetical protein